METDLSDPIELTKQLVRVPSVTPDQGECLRLIETWLRQLGFEIQHFPFGEGAERVDNLYARRNQRVKTDAALSPCLAFAGHSDVVPAGNESAWQQSPFDPAIKDGVLYGRGVADMKGAIAAFIAAIARLDAAGNAPAGDLALLITGDEEGPSIHGMKPMLEALAGQGERWSACITGEPTNPDYIGQMIKIGRRGSLHGTLQVTGKQGHTGYPALADNAAHRLVSLCQALLAMKLDDGSDYFEPSNLAISTIDIGNDGRNIIPGHANVNFNVRFNDLHTGESLEKQIRACLDAANKTHAGQGAYRLEVKVSGESFLTQEGELSQAIQTACEKIMGAMPILSTTGGTSDSRFIKDYCPVVDFGLVGRSMHMVNEESTLDEIESLTRIYHQVIHDFLPKSPN